MEDIREYFLGDVRQTARIYSRGSARHDRGGYLLANGEHGAENEGGPVLRAEYYSHFWSMAKHELKISQIFFLSFLSLSFVRSLANSFSRSFGLFSFFFLRVRTGFSAIYAHIHT